MDQIFNLIQNDQAFTNPYDGTLNLFLDSIETNDLTNQNSLAYTSLDPSDKITLGLLFTDFEAELNLFLVHTNKSSGKTLETYPNISHMVSIGNAASFASDEIGCNTIHQIFGSIQKFQQIISKLYSSYQTLLAFLQNPTINVTILIANIAEINSIISLQRVSDEQAFTTAHSVATRFAYTKSIEANLTNICFTASVLGSIASNALLIETDKIVSEDEAEKQNLENLSTSGEEAIANPPEVENPSVLFGVHLV